MPILLGAALFGFGLLLFGFGVAIWLIGLALRIAIRLFQLVLLITMTGITVYSWLQQRRLFWLFYRVHRNRTYSE
jgi:hypothetical protein